MILFKRQFPARQRNLPAAPLLHALNNPGDRHGIMVSFAYAYERACRETTSKPVNDFYPSACAVAVHGVHQAARIAVPDDAIELLPNRVFYTYHADAAGSQILVYTVDRPTLDGAASQILMNLLTQPQSPQSLPALCDVKEDEALRIRLLARLRDDLLLAVGNPGNQSEAEHTYLLSVDVNRYIVSVCADDEAQDDVGIVVRCPYGEGSKATPACDLEFQVRLRFAPTPDVQERVSRVIDSYL